MQSSHPPMHCPPGPFESPAIASVAARYVAAFAVLVGSRRAPHSVAFTCEGGRRVSGLPSLLQTLHPHKLWCEGEIRSTLCCGDPGRRQPQNAPATSWSAHTL